MFRQTKLHHFFYMVAAFLVTVISTTASAKSLYVIDNINATPTPISTYDIQAAPTYLVLQSTSSVPRRAGGAVGMGLDETNEILFVTYEVSNTIQMVNAKNFAALGTTTAPGATNLAGIVVDHANSKVYTVDRNTNHLYVYSWNAATTTLTLDGGAFKNLTGVTSAHGIALDESRGRLYVGDRNSTTVLYFNTSSFTGATTISSAGSVDLSSEGQTAMAVAIDQVRNILYSGNAYGPYGSRGKLVKHDLNTSTTTAYTLPGAPVGGSSSGDNIVGVAVDEDTGNVYATTGNQGSGGTDTLIVFSSSLAVLKNDLGSIGNPTGLAIPRTQVSFNPLNFTKTESSDPIPSGSNLTYTVCYDNTANATPVTNVVITDGIPSGTTFVSATGPYATTPTTVTWSIATVAAGAAQVCYNLVVNVTAASGSTITNSATIDSTETPPTTKVVTTTVGGTSGGGVTFAGEGDGGTASTGPLELLFGLMVLPFMLARRKYRVGALLLIVTSFALVTTSLNTAQADDSKRYIGFSFGNAHTDVKNSEYDNALAGLGYTTTSTIDNNNWGYKLYLGYRLNKTWDVEVSYTDLGEVLSSTTVTSPALTTAALQQQFVNAAATVHPYSIDALSIAGKANWNASPNVTLFAKGGLFAWKADIIVRCVGCSSSIYAPDDESGADWLIGFGALYKYNKKIGVRMEYERFNTDRYDLDFLSFGIQSKF